MNTNVPPLEDYDQLSVGAIGERIRVLDQDGLDQLLAYEQDHADRLAVLQMIRARLAALEGGAEPAAGPERGFPPADAGVEAPRREDARTDAPPNNPPSHGDPTNPSQPR